MPDTPSPKHGLVRPADADFINSWPASMRSVVDWLDPNVATFTETDPRPAAGVSGRFHRHPTTGALSFDTGAAWVDVPFGSVAARLAAGGTDPLSVTLSMLAADVPIPNVGDMFPTARQTLPANGKWAWCNGETIRADLYPAYAAAVGHPTEDPYNGGPLVGNDVSGNPLVRLPNKLGRGSIGASPMGGVAGTGMSTRLRGARIGAERVALSGTELPVHAHTASQVSHSHTQILRVSTPGGDVASTQAMGTHGSLVLGNQLAGELAAVAPAITVAPSGGSSGVTQSHENMHPVEVDNWIVRIA